MIDREECLRLLLEFVRTGDVEQAATAAGTILAYLTTLQGKDMRLTALDDLRVELARRCEEAGISGEGEDRHIVVETALERARSTLESKSA